MRARGNLSRFRVLENRGNVLLLYPEGTRSTTGEMGKFRPGIGLLLAGTQIPMVLCHLENTFRALRKGTWIPRPRTVRPVIGPPRNYARLRRGKDSGVESCQGLREAVRTLGTKTSS
jgi:1-acyl-sn-glycerol-3-phosphate acyltransferase